jgi:hypothetical protein
MRDEKEIIELSNEIIESIGKISSGEEPGLFSDSAFENLYNNVEAFKSIKDAYISYLQNFTGKDHPVKEISGFRFLIVEKYEEFFPENG